MQEIQNPSYYFVLTRLSRRSYNVQQSTHPDCKIQGTPETYIVLFLERDSFRIRTLRCANAAVGGLGKREIDSLCCFEPESNTELPQSMADFLYSVNGDDAPNSLLLLRSPFQLLQLCFDLWSSAEDEVRLSALLAMRTLVGSQDDSIVDLVLRVSRPLHH